jgi:hypothetical protein
VRSLAMPEFDGNEFINNGALKDDRYIKSIPKPKVIKIDSVFNMFRPNNKSNVICPQPFIKTFKLTAKDAGA